MKCADNASLRQRFVSGTDTSERRTWLRKTETNGESQATNAGFSRAKNYGFSRAKNFGFSRAKNFGFSLVELIVVIAIMAILVGVAVPVYTGYIAKTQKAADTQLVDEVKRAVEIKLIADCPAGFAGGVVITLSKDGAQVDGGNDADKAFVQSALAETFGDDWEHALTLKYDGWESGTAQTVVTNYTGSSYEGNEEALLAQIQVLANALTDIAAGRLTGNEALADMAIGDGFSNFLNENGISDAGTGNAAVLYVAQVMSDEKALQDTLANIVKNGTYADDENLELTANTSVAEAIAQAIIYEDDDLLRQLCGGSSGAALATKYAYLEACAQATENANVIARFNSLSIADFVSENEAYNIARDDIFTAGDTFHTYDFVKDAQAFLSVMQAVNQSKDSVMNNIDSLECYTDGTLLSKLNAYLQIGNLQIDGGYLAVVVNAAKDGFDVLAYPLDY